MLNELIFSRVKAYNHVQMFSFITECMELYYCRKLLSAAHNRLDRYISLKYQGLNCSKISWRASVASETLTGVTQLKIGDVYFL